MVRSNVTPPQIRAMTVASGSPLSIAAILSGTIIELGCNAYTRQEADGRYLSSTGYTSTLDPRYLAQNATPGSAEVFTLIRDPNAAPRQLRGILPRAPLSWQNILSGTVTELFCDSYSKAESDGRYALQTTVSSLDTRVTALEGGPVPDPLIVSEVQTTDLKARTGDNLLTITGGVNGVSVLGAGLAATGAILTTSQLTAPRLEANAGESLLQIVGGIGGTLVQGALQMNGVITKGQGAPELLLSSSTLVKLATNQYLFEADTASTALYSVINAGTGDTEIEMVANSGGGTANLLLAALGGLTVEAPAQEIKLQNQTGGAVAPLIVETNGVITTSYGQNDLSDAKVKENIRDADVEEMQEIFDRATPKRYRRKDVELDEQLGFLAQDFEGAGVTGKTRRGGEELLTLNYGRLTAVLWGVCKKLQARVEALESKKKPKSKGSR